MTLRFTLNPNANFVKAKIVIQEHFPKVELNFEQDLDTGRFTLSLPKYSKSEIETEAEKLLARGLIYDYYVE